MNNWYSHKALFKLPLQLLLISLSLSACSTVVEGRSQQIQVVTAPAGATCTLKSNDDVIGIVPSTPGSINVEKSKYDIIVECTKEGYLKGKTKDHSDYAITALGNLAFMQLSFVGNMIDSATGASNKYDTKVYVALEKAPDTIAQLPVQQAPVQQAMIAPAPQPVQYTQPVQAAYIQPAPSPVAQYAPSPQPAMAQPTMEVAQLYIPQAASDAPLVSAPMDAANAKQAPFDLAP